MSRRILLLTFDAFGTLFTPRRPITAQYAEVAARHGLAVDEHALQSTFRDAFRHQSANHPNYGKASGMKPTEWWAAVIRRTFAPWTQEEEEGAGALPEAAIADLLTRFSSREGYMLYPDVGPFFRLLQARKHGRLPAGRDWPWDLTVCGVVSNSDDRVSSILTSLGLDVAATAAVSVGPSSRKRTATTSASSSDADISFVSLSYDVGYQKPDVRIFAAAAERGRAALLNGRQNSDITLSVGEGHQRASDAGSDPASPVMTAPTGEWTYLHVGDNIEQDVLGAKSAGWNSVLLDRAGRYADQCEKGTIGTVKVDPGQTSGNRWHDGHIQVIRDLAALRHWKP